MFANVQYFIVLVISVVVFVLAVWAIINAVRYSNQTFVNAGKNKTLWVGILSVAGLILFVSLPEPLGRGRGFIGLLSIASIVAVLYYLVDVRKKLQGHQPPRSGGGYSTRGGW